MRRILVSLALLLLWRGGAGAPPAAGDEPGASEAERISRLLAPGDVLVRLANDASAEPQFAVVVAPGAPARLQRQPNAIAAACEALRSACRTQADPKEVARAIDVLRDLVVAPLELPAEARRLVVATDGALSQAPWSLLVPDLPVTLVASNAAYLELLERPTLRGEGVLALGDPAYDRPGPPPPPDPARPRARVRRLHPLPGTRLEARAVGETVLLGAEASEIRLRESLARPAPWRSVHLACHGRFDLERPTLSWLALAPTADDDGRLTVLDVLSLACRTELVVLSASESARGKLVAGTSPIGFPTAFLRAGAPRVLGALWREVDDEATAALMKRFYELWSPKDGTPGLPTAEALRQAQSYVRAQEKWKHPYYWAAWVLWGLPS